MATVAKRRTVPPSGRIAYSYCRFSYTKQKLGDSEQRQIDTFTQWADRHGHTINLSIKFDKARSAFRGKHRKRGYLGQFLERVKAGEIPEGSLLVVEEVRRFSREGSRKALETTVFKLFNAGITLQFLAPEVFFNSENIDNVPGTMSNLAFMLDLAYAESKQKSEWANASSDRKLTDVRNGSGALLRHPHPGWLYIAGREYNESGRVVKDGKLKPFPGVERTMTMLLERAEQKDGATAIARYLNQHATWNKGKWTDAYVKKVWKNRRLIGEHQPTKLVIVKEKGDEVEKMVPNGDPIPDYYPAVVDRKLFLRVQQILNGHKSTGGRSDQCHNVLQSLAVCAYCHGPMYHKPRSKKENGPAILFCYHGMNRKSKCGYNSIPYQICEDAVLAHYQNIKPEQVLPTKGAQAKLVTRLRQRIQRNDALLQEFESEINTLMTRTAKLDEDDPLADRYDKEVRKRESEKAKLEMELAADRQELFEAEQERRTFDERQSDMARLRASLVKPENRKRLNAYLHEIIDKIEVFPKGHAEAYNDNFDEYLAAAEYETGFRTPKAQQFIAWVTTQRMTKRGRFLRIHYRMSEGRREQLRDMWGVEWKDYVDVVPTGSIAGSPSMGELWDEFSKQSVATTQPTDQPLRLAERVRVGRPRSRRQSSVKAALSSGKET